MSLETKKVPVFSLDGTIIEEALMPAVFNTPLRLDLIRKAYLSFASFKRQPQGRDPLAGKRVSVESFGTGREMARIPRHSNGRGGFVPMARGGYKPHPPRVDERIYEEINLKEKRLALRSAVASMCDYELVVKRGHKFEKDVLKSLPVVVTDEIENLAHTRDAFFFLQKIGIHPDIIRVKEGIKIRAGKGKLRGRRLKRRVGPLIVVSTSSCPAIKAFRNIEGVDIIGVDKLNIGLVAPGGFPGRLAVFSKKALSDVDRWLV